MLFNVVTVHLFSASTVVKKTQCIPIPLSSLAKPVERFRYSRVAHLEAGRNLVANIKMIETPTHNYTEHKCNTNLY